MKELPLPGFFNPAMAERIDAESMIQYEALFAEALAWRKTHGITTAARDAMQIGLLLIDVQNTFCMPNGQLFVGGASSRGAVDDSIRTAEFIYRELGNISSIYCTMDTHDAFQIFHRLFWVDVNGEYPAPATIITAADVKAGKWSVNPTMAANTLDNPSKFVGLQAHAQHYVEELETRNKYPLMIWPHHAMFGGVDHALVPLIQQAVYFHSIARQSRAELEVKGGNPITENYSVLSPEVLTNATGDSIAKRNTKFIQMLLDNDVLIIAGQAKSHCVAWTIHDLLEDINRRDKTLAKKVYLMEDCTSPVVIPGVHDFTPEADQAFADFVAGGMNLAKSTDSLATWKGVTL